MKKLTKIMLATAAAASAATAGFAYAAPGGEGRPDQTRAQAQDHATKMFERMDANKDGKLDKADHEARQTGRFDRLDTDKNGSLSREEFNTRPQRAEKAPDGQKAEGRRGDGKHFGGRHHGGRGGGKHGGFMMKQADTNNDGAISQAEFVASHLAKFDAADADKNGTVTSAERKAQHEKMRAEWQAKRAAQQPKAQ